MRHKYETRGIVLARAPLGEANAHVTLLTQELGLVRARAQGLRQPGAKLAAALTTFAESELVLVHGKEGWRVAGAVLEKDWFSELRHEAVYTRAARICSLLLRVVAGETQDESLFAAIKEFFEALTARHESEHDAAEILAALRMLATLGFIAGNIPSGAPASDPDVLAAVAKGRAAYITRINEAIAASGL